MTDLLNIAKECGATSFGINYPGEYIQIRDDQLHATVEKVCGPLVEALEKLTRGPVKPFPDPSAHSWEAFAKAVLNHSADVRFQAIKALREHREKHE